MHSLQTDTRGALPDCPESDFRSAAGKFASGVTVVTTRNGCEVLGKTISAFGSLSLDPLMVSVSIGRMSPLVTAILNAEIFAVSVLRDDQQHVSRHFSTRGNGRSVGDFPTIRTRKAITGAPVISGCLSYFDCRLENVVGGGDHAIVIGRVTAAESGKGHPLLYFDGGYREIQSPAPAAGVSAH
ncbi:flavin reductase [Streptomyces glebosus]|uniref:Flavin reductase n=1 Tax=Streptomyces glebosus TaxID=249580 RepID=A0A640SZM0_9ACTN|nr:flavin reductase family protein [Streptomyces glebosus]GFE16889.1 flavin reductase [Streptomyces glebosus]GHG86613.1 flavin reductase [Streptomyces glebosus]